MHLMLLCAAWQHKAARVVEEGTHRTHAHALTARTLWAAPQIGVRRWRQRKRRHTQRERKGAERWSAPSRIYGGGCCAGGHARSGKAQCCRVREQQQRRGGERRPH